MRVEIKTTAKKESGLGIGFIAAFAALCGAAYIVAAPEHAGMFPLPVERALTNYRSQIDTMAEDVRRGTMNTYTAIAGR